MKVLLLGGTGLLGKALVREWRDDEVLAMGSRDVDIREAGKVQEVVSQARPDWIGKGREAVRDQAHFS